MKGKDEWLRGWKDDDKEERMKRWKDERIKVWKDESMKAQKREFIKMKKVNTKIKRKGKMKKTRIKG